MTANDSFSDRLLKWYAKHGRHDLPWQIDSNPYRVWVSEIMLQQTQVATVIPYFERFIDSFPDVVTLGKAKLDNVLHHWTGLGYYARARNMHKAAKIIINDHHALFPETYNELLGLPGIGRSTAGAILSLSLDKRYPILDGNVKRVLSRHHGIEGWPGKKSVETKLWQLADSHTPKKSVANYTQAIMDLGATVCVRRNPTCTDCPVMKSCVARKTGRQHDFPGSKPWKTLPVRETRFAIIENDKGEVLLEQRPPSGIWGSLWCFPEIEMNKSIASVMQKQYGYKIKQHIEYKSIKHTFSHFHLQIKPVHIYIKDEYKRVSETNSLRWLSPVSRSNLGYPAPVLSMLQDLNNKERVFLHES